MAILSVVSPNKILLDGMAAGVLAPAAIKKIK
jgi:hypothetical protein